ncbi:MAG: non-ribosomal peptide synthetase, partial [Tumebacillaceae bacterium]
MSKSPKLDRNNVEEIMALSPVQEGILFHYLTNPEQYVEQLGMTITGEIDLEHFKQAWATVAQANEMLRTVYRWEGLEHPMQIVLKHLPIPVRQVDCSHLSGAELEQAIQLVKEQDRKAHIDLMSEPFRITLCQRTATQTEIFITNHHILYDGWSNGILLREFFTTYQQLVSGQQPTLPKKPRFQSYIKWLQAADRGEQKAFRQRYLQGFEAKTGLSNQKPESVGNPCVTSYTHTFSADFSAALQSFLKAQKLTLANVVYAAWSLLLARYQLSEDIVFGTTDAGRMAKVPGIEEMVGMFINTMPLRVQFDSQMAVLDFMREVDRQVHERDNFLHTPILDVKSYCGFQQSESLFDSNVVVDNFPLDVKQLTDAGNKLSVESFTAYEMTNFELTVKVMNFHELQVEFMYHASSFTSGLIEQMCRHLVTCMEQMVAQPERSLAEIELLSEAERHQLVTEFNDTDVDFGQVVCLHEVFERKVQQHPERVALVLGDASLTYGELNQRANRLARKLRTAGVGPDQVVGLLAVRSFEMIVSIMAILKAGGAYLPIDPELPTERIRFLLEDSRTQVLLAMRDALQGQEFDIQTFELDDLALDSGPADNLDVVGTPSDLAYLIYTSGTTGKPKGVMVEHRQAFNLLMVMETAYPLLSNGSFLFKTNYAFDVSVAEVFGWFFGEGRLVILPPKLEKEPMAILREIERQQVTHVNFTASMLNVLLPSLEQPGITGLDNVSYVMVAGEVLPPKTVEVFYRLTRNVRLENLYGPTETTVYATMQSLDRGTVHTKILIGRPMPNVQAYIVDTDNRLQPIGCVGEICLGGANVTRGYWGRPELSAEKYIDNPFDEGTKIYRSGDLGRWLPDGRIEFLGRIDHQVKVRGYRIELGEV